MVSGNVRMLNRPGPKSPEEHTVPAMRLVNRRLAILERKLHQGYHTHFWMSRNGLPCEDQGPGRMPTIPDVVESNFCILTTRLTSFILACDHREQAESAQDSGKYSRPQCRRG